MMILKRVQGWVRGLTCARLQLNSFAHIPLTLLLSTATPTVLDKDPTTNQSLIFSDKSVTQAFEPSELSFESGVHSIIDPAIYLGAGVFFGCATFLTAVGGAIGYLFPWTSTIGSESLLASQILGIVTVQSLTQAVKKSPCLSFLCKQLPSSYSAWNLNKARLSQVPAVSNEDKELLSFLSQRWLAKITGCYPFLVNWLCPSFGISFQVHPETTNSYARDPSTKLFDTYKIKLEAWKRSLPHPYEFPLILTRPTNIGEYLPLYLEVASHETTEEIAQKLAQIMPGSKYPVTVDLTPVLNEPSAWNHYKTAFLSSCHAHKLDVSQIICIHRVCQKEVGGIRLLPLEGSPEKNYQFLFEWICRFGLSANRIELDRALSGGETASLEPPIERIGTLSSQEQWRARLNSIDKTWHSSHPQKSFLFKGTLQVLKDLCASTSPAQWEKNAQSPTLASITELCLTHIQTQLLHLAQAKEELSFHEFTSYMEQIHADLSSLLEVLSPFSILDFKEAFKRHLTSIPDTLQPLTQYGLHSSAMASLAGILKATTHTLGRLPRVLYGNNIYFEGAMILDRVTHATAINEATDQDWQDVDLILAQFNPTVKRISFKVTEYQTTEYQLENVSAIIHKALQKRKNKPLSVALDGTLDFSNSKRIHQLLTKFQREIEKGDLNIICYRSGLKFDLFGMDNYCGAPFYMVHNYEAKWACFDSLLSDPVLQTDRLSLNWFALAYQQAGDYLESYREQIFTNTRAILNKVPQQLFDANNPRYRIIPVQAGVDPSFIDIKVFGPMHKLRGEFLVAMFLTIKCMQAGHPLLYRPGIGFYHPNLAVLYGTDCTTIRLTVGLDPAQVDVVVQCLKKISTLNGFF